MIGAIFTIAAMAFLCSTVATIGNFAIARDFPDFELDQDADVFSDFLMDSAMALRYMQYRLMTNIFYYQSLMLWSLLVVLVIYKFLIGSPS